MVKAGKGGFRNADKAVLAAVDEDKLFETRESLTEDPADARLTLDGAVVGQDGKLDLSAYEDLHSWFAGEPSPDKHPCPGRPGVRRGEEVPKGMRIWDDLRAGAKGKDGAGWIASRQKKNEPKKERWFNIRSCGSWRLAFLLAKLQRDLWEYRGAGRGLPAPAAAEEATTPTKKRKEPAGAASTRKRAKPESQVPSVPPSGLPPPKMGALGAEAMVAGSARLQQILAARQAQAEQQQQQQQQEQQEQEQQPQEQQDQQLQPQPLQGVA